ncbi:MAG: hypothetical protein QXP39_00140 [Candidatus Aenigmatarchaeota archaeon]
MGIKIKRPIYESKEKYFKRIEKWFVILFSILIILIVLYGINWSFQKSAWELGIFFVILVVILIPITIVAIDMITWEGE